MNYIAFILTLLIASSYTTRVAILNDLHLDPYFDPAVVSQNDCRGPNPFSLLEMEVSKFAPFGRYGCDVPVNLINLFMGHLNKTGGDIDVILVSGDYTAHDIASKRGRSEPNYAMLKSIISQNFAQYINPLFPDSIVIPAIGNNDVKFHYEFPTTEEDIEDYYGFLYNLWWEQLEANSQYKGKKDIKKTLMNGGYFVYHHSDVLSFMAVNSLYFSVKNEKFPSKVSNEQLDWIEETLKNADKNRKFIINMHVFPGMYNPGEKQQFWIDEFNNRFDNIMKKYGDKVLLLNGAHTHIADVRASWTEDEETGDRKPYYANFVSPSFSPFYLNNPGFTIFDIDDEENKIDDITTHFLQLDKTYSDTGDHIIEYHSVNFQEEFGIKEWSPQEIMEFGDRAKADDALFKKFLVLKLGYRLDQEQEALGVYSNLGMIDFEDDNKLYWCFFEHIRSDNYDTCIGDSSSAGSFLKTSF